MQSCDWAARADADVTEVVHEYGLGRIAICRMQRVSVNAGNLQRGQRIRSRGDKLARAERGEGAVARGANGDFEPAIRSGEDVGTEVEQDGEQPLADGDSRESERPGESSSAAAFAKSENSKWSAPLARAGPSLSRSLIGERGALGIYPCQSAAQ